MQCTKQLLIDSKTIRFNQQCNRLDFQVARASVADAIDLSSIPYSGQTEDFKEEIKFSCGEIASEHACFVHEKGAQRDSRSFE